MAIDPEMMVAEAPAPFPTGLSKLPSTDFWDERQWATLFAFMEAAMPAIASKSTIKDEHNQLRIPDAEFDAIFKRLGETLTNAPSKEALRSYLAKRCTEDPEYIETCKRMLCSFPPSKTGELGTILVVLTYVCWVNTSRGPHVSRL